MYLFNDSFFSKTHFKTIFFTSAVTIAFMYVAYGENKEFFRLSFLIIDNMAY